MPDTTDIVWSTEVYSPAELNESYVHKLPILVKVTHGYYGQSEAETFASGQLLRLAGYGTQKRVLARDERRRTISIPVAFPIRFQVRGQSGYTRSLTLAQILEDHDLPVKVRFDQSEPDHFYVGSDTKSTETFGEIELHRVYQERFLTGNTLTQGVIEVDSTIMVPLYLKIFLGVAKGLKGKNEKEWAHFQEYYTSRVQHLHFNHLKGNPNIMLYCVIDTDEYDTLEPEQLQPHYYVRHGGLSYSTSFRTKSMIEDDEANDYDVIEVENGASMSGSDRVTKKPIFPPILKRKDSEQESKEAISPTGKVRPAVKPKPKQEIYENSYLLGRKRQDRNGHVPPQAQQEAHSIRDSSVTFKCPSTAALVHFKSFEDVPQDTRSLTVEEVADCIQLLNLEAYAEEFIGLQIDGEFVNSLQESDLREEFEMSALNARRIVKFFQDGWRPRTQSIQRQEKA